jgi:hypothetical protein
MAAKFTGSTIAVALVAAAVGAGITLAVMRTGAPSSASIANRTPDGKPDFSGIWQALNEAHWDLEAHEARPGAVMQQGVYPYEYARVAAAPVLALGAAGGVPGSVGVVEGDGAIPYKPEAAKVKQENGENWIDRDPELKCYLPGIPRAMYMPYPFQIVQGTNKVHMAFAFTSTARTIHLDPVEGPPDLTYMGHSVGRWDAMRLTERFTPITKDAIHYQATIEDPNVFIRPWTISMPLYRRLEGNAQLMEYRCIEFVEEFMYGGLRRKPLVTRWEGETMIVDIRRKVPEGDKLYEWYRR